MGMKIEAFVKDRGSRMEKLGAQNCHELRRKMKQKWEKEEGQALARKQEEDDARNRGITLPDVDQATATGVTPLFIAAKHGDQAIVESLLSAKANVESAHFEGITVAFA